MKLYPQGKNKTLLVLGDNTEIYFSYQTPVAARIDGHLYKTDTEHSATTARHLNEYIAGEKPTTLPQEFFDTIVAAK